MDRKVPRAQGASEPRCSGDAGRSIPFPPASSKVPAAPRSIPQIHFSSRCTRLRFPHSPAHPPGMSGEAVAGRDPRTQRTAPAQGRFYTREGRNPLSLKFSRSTNSPTSPPPPALVQLDCFGRKLTDFQLPEASEGPPTTTTTSPRERTPRDPERPGQWGRSPLGSGPPAGYAA